jgi:hypothetical protein
VKGGFLQESLRDWHVWALFLSLQIPSLRALFKYIPASLLPVAVPVYLAGIWVFYALLLHHQGLRRFLCRSTKSALPLVVLLLLIITASAVLYPIGDARKQLGMGSNQDDALILAGRNLLSGHHPYYQGGQALQVISAGPGWILLTLPFTATGLYVLLIPAVVGAAAFVVNGNRRNFLRGSLFILLLMSSLAFWELLAAGSDIVPLGCVFVIGAIAVYHSWKSSSQPPCTLAGGLKRAGAALLLAFASTGRIVFFFFVPLLARFLWKRNKSSGWIFLILAGAVLLALHLIFYFWNTSWYMPTHIFGKSLKLAGPWFLSIGLIACAAALALAISKATEGLSSWLFYLWVVAAAAMAFAGLGDLLSCGFHLAQWEGANYMAMQMAMGVGFVALTEMNSLSKQGLETSD